MTFFDKYMITLTPRHRTEDICIFLKYDTYNYETKTHSANNPYVKLKQWIIWSPRRTIYMSQFQVQWNLDNPDDIIPSEIVRINGCLD